MASLIAAAALLASSSLKMPWEQDQPAKAAQIHALIAHGFQLSESPDFYRKNQFALYYYIASFFKKTSGLPDYIAMNILAIISGGIFFAIAVTIAKNFLKSPPLLALAVFLSCPTIFISFTYGNEAGIALMFLALSLFFTLSAKRTLIRPMLSGIALLAAALNRLDYAAFIPILPLFFLLSKDRPFIQRDKTRILQATLQFCTASVGFILFYTLIVRDFPQGSRFEYSFSLKQAGAYLVYGLGLFLIIPAFLGVWEQFRRNWIVSLLLLAIAAHAIVYLQMFSSPKYVLPLFFVACLFASIGFTHIWKLTKLGAAALLITPWLVSITPFGLKSGASGALYFIPTDDGPLPSGSYFSFYGFCSNGFFQQRYIDEENQIRKALAIMPSLANPTIVGFFNQQTPMLIGARQGDFKFAQKFWPNPDSPPGVNDTAIMIKTSYLNPRKMSSKVRDWFNSSLKNGSIIPAFQEDNPFPDVILVSNTQFSDKDLAKRIQFLFDLGGNEQWLERKTLIENFNGTSWKKIDSKWIPLGQSDIGHKFYSLKSPAEILALNPQQ